MTGLAYWVRVDGVPGGEIADHSAPTWETLIDGGCGLSSTTFSTSLQVPPHALRKGARYEIFAGMSPLYTGWVTEYDRRSGVLHAAGLASQLYRFLALEEGDVPTRDIGNAVSTAKFRGWMGSNPYGIDGIVDGDSTGNPITVGALLDAFCEQTGQRWGCDQRGNLYLWTPPTQADWIVSPGGAAFGETNEDSPTFLAGRYETTLGANATAYAGTVGLEGDVDLTDRGPLTEAEAEGILAGMLERKSGTSFVNSVDLTSEQITTLGGSPAFLPTVRAGQFMRSFGVGHISSGAFSLDSFIGKTSYTAGASTINVEPLNTAPRKFVDVVAAA